MTKQFLSQKQEGQAKISPDGNSRLQDKDENYKI